MICSTDYRPKPGLSDGSPKGHEHRTLTHATPCSGPLSVRPPHEALVESPQIVGTLAKLVASDTRDSWLLASDSWDRSRSVCLRYLGFALVSCLTLDGNGHNLRLAPMARLRWDASGSGVPPLQGHIAQPRRGGEQVHPVARAVKVFHPDRPTTCPGPTSPLPLPLSIWYQSSCPSSLMTYRVPCRVPTSMLAVAHSA